MIRLCKWFLTGVLVLLFNLSYPQTIWQRVYGSTQYSESCWGSRSTYDGGNIMTNRAVINSNHDFTWLVKTDINGNIRWQRYIGLPYDALPFGSGYNIEYDSVRSMYLTGYTQLSADGLSPMLIKLDACAEPVWCRIASGFKGPAFGSMVRCLPDQSLIMLSYNASLLSNYTEDVQLWKFDNNGNLMWMKQLMPEYSYPTVKDIELDDFFYTSDHGLMLSGSCYVLPYPQSSLVYLSHLFVKTDTAANVQWYTTYRIPWGMDTMGGESLSITELNGFYYAGGYNYHNNSTAIYPIWPFMIKLDLSGNIVDTGFVHKGDSLFTQVRDVNVVNDSIFLLSCFDQSYELGHSVLGMYLSDTSLSGYRKYLRNMTGPPTAGGACSRTPDNKYFIGGTKIISTYSPRDVFLVKVNEDLSYDSIFPDLYTYDSLCDHVIPYSDSIICDCTLIMDMKAMEPAGEGSNHLHISPNPATAHIDAACDVQDHAMHSEGVIFIYNGMGTVVKKIVLSDISETKRINLTGLSSGCYYVQLMTLRGDWLGYAKFIIL